ncbi:hypothetical protein SH611_17315 [Geminicoccaceae bacterium 1502E]|nr:hypothetical protein [Geminicoccaceae bacterium 1502E]
MNAWRYRLCGLLLGGLLAGPAQGQTVNYDALDAAAQSAVDAACESWAIDEKAPDLAHWMASIEALCDAREQADRRTPAAQPGTPETRP